MRYIVKTGRLDNLILNSRVLGRTKLEQIARSTVTFTAKDYAAWKLKRLNKDIDRPMPFTRRAYDWDGADRKAGSKIEARAFVRPKQEKYLSALEFGQEKRYGKGGALSVAPDKRDKYGGLGLGKRDAIQRRFLKRSGKRVRYVLASPNGPTTGKDARMKNLTGGSKFGVFQITRGNRKKGVKDKVRRIVFFEPGKIAKWDPQLDFRKDGKMYGKREMPRKAQSLLRKEIAKSLGLK